MLTSKNCFLAIPISSTFAQSNFLPYPKNYFTLTQKCIFTLPKNTSDPYPKKI